MNTRKQTMMKTRLGSITCLVIIAVVIVGCSKPGSDSATKSHPGAQDFEPVYIGGYPTNGTVEAMFEEYDYFSAAGNKQSVTPPTTT